LFSKKISCTVICSHSDIYGFSMIIQDWDPFPYSHGNMMMHSYMNFFLIFKWFHKFIFPMSKNYFNLHFDCHIIPNTFDFDNVGVNFWEATIVLNIKSLNHYFIYFPLSLSLSNTSFLSSLLSSISNLILSFQSIPCTFWSFLLSLLFLEYCQFSSWLL